MILLHIIQKLRPDEHRPPPGLAPFGVMDVHRIEPLRIRVGKRLHHDVVNHAENRRGRPNPQRQRQHGNHPESRCLPQLPHCVPDVLPQRSHVCPQSSLYLLKLLIRQSSVPHPVAAGGTCPDPVGSPAPCSGGAFVFLAPPPPPAGPPLPFLIFSNPPPLLAPPKHKKKTPHSLLPPPPPPPP